MEQQIISDGYKLTELGILPEDWDLLELGDIAKFKGGFAFKSKNLLTEGKYQLIKMSNLYKGILNLQRSQSFLNDLTQQEKEFLLKENDLLLTLTGTVGKEDFGYSSRIKNDCNLLLNQRVSKLVINSLYNAVLAEYEFKYPRFLSQFFLRAKGGTGNQTNVSTTDCSSILIPIPIKREQTAIANALSDVDALIASIKKLIAKKQAIKTATMQQLLTGKKRLPPFDKYQEGPNKGQTKGTQQTELGEIPEDWVVKTYEEIFHFLTTASNSRSDLSQSDDCYYIHYGDIHTKWDNCLDINATPVPQISSEKVKATPKLKKGDLIMADASEDYAGIGKSIEITGLNGKEGVSGLHTFLLRDKSDTYIDGFKGYLHEIKAVKGAFDKLATGLKVYGLSKNSLRTISLPIPPKSEQQSIINIITDMDLCIKIFKDRLTKTQQIKQGMMQELLTGKTRLV
jgi:type I restriction enzyme S subunit